MANSLLIEKQTGGYFKFTLNGDTANAITSIQNDLLAVGNQLHFKTGNGANIIKEQFIYPEDITIISGGTFTFTTVAQVWDKLIDIDYFAWLGGGGSIGIDRFNDLVDTFKYTGNAGKTVVVDNSELRLVPITLYNKRLFTELEDTPSSLVPNKMLVVNPAGTAVVLQDQPEQSEQLLNSVGYFDYNDLITQTTPLNAVANVALKLTNDTEGANTSTDQNPYGVSYVWDYTTNQFNFNELEVGDTIDVRIHVQVTTTSANQKVLLSAKLGIGSVAEFTNIIYENQFKTAGLHEVSVVAPFYMGSTDITDYPAELYLTTDASATVKVDGWYVRILRKNINIITVDYTVPDATTTVKGIVRLAGDLAGTANSPTVPELANKVPNTRTVSTTSPLLGGGALSSNLTLSIQQANSVDSGYLSYVDWNTFNNKASDSNVVHLTGAETITGLKTFSADLNISDLYINGYSGTSGRLSLKQANSAGFSGIGYTTINALGTSTLVLNFRQSDGTNKTMQISANLIGSVQRVFQFPDADGTVALTSDLHSAVTIGTANGLSLSGQALSLGLASTSSTGALSAADWATFNSKQSALSGTGFVKISGSTISYDNSTYVPTSRTLTINGTAYDLSADRSWTISAGVSGTGTTNYIPKFTGSSALGNSSFFDNGSNDSGITNASYSQFILKGSGTNDTGGGVLKFSNQTKDFAQITGETESASNGMILFRNLRSGTITESMRITSGGNVGIGTTSPSEKLTVSNGKLALTTDDVTIGGKIYGYNDTSVNLYSGGLKFQTRYFDGSNYVYADRLTLNSSGNVGIGTSSPSAKLDVVGGGIRFGNGTIIGELGYSSRAEIGTISNHNLGFTTNSITQMLITSGGNVGIGTTSPSTKLDVVGAITASGGFFNSDMRLKDLTEYEYKVSDIKPITYLWKDGRDNKKHVGYSAQEVQKVMPDAVNQGTDGMLSVNYVEVLVAKIAELENRIKQLEK